MGIRKRILAALLIPLAALAALVLCFASEELEVTFYQLPSAKLPPGETIRLAVLADLHNREYGEKNADLIEEIRSQKPDLILMAGDMVNYFETRTDIVVDLCKALQEIAPVFYGLGNHEGTLIYASGIPLHEELREAGICVLINDSQRITVRDTEFYIGGTAVSEENYEKHGKTFLDRFWEKETDAFKLLISHFPSLYYEILADIPMDLGICGHYHGGQIQIPGLGGLYSVKHGLFPQYCQGIYQLENASIFVSRGMGSGHKIPRINNRPELAFIDIISENNP